MTSGASGTLSKPDMGSDFATSVKDTADILPQIYGTKYHKMPDLKVVVTGTGLCYRRDDGVYVIPIGCLKD